MNREIIQGLIDFYQIPENEDKLYMGLWICNNDLSVTNVPIGSLFQQCGTSGCILGTAIALYRPDMTMQDKNGFAEFDSGDKIYNCYEIGQELFELSENELSRLFHVMYWDYEWKQKYSDNPAATVVEILQKLLNGESVFDFLSSLNGVIG